MCGDSVINQLNTLPTFLQPSLQMTNNDLSYGEHPLGCATRECKEDIEKEIFTWLLLTARPSVARLADACWLFTNRFTDPAIQTITRSAHRCQDSKWNAQTLASTSS